MAVRRRGGYWPLLMLVVAGFGVVGCGQTDGQVDVAAEQTVSTPDSDPATDNGDGDGDDGEVAAPVTTTTVASTTMMTLTDVELDAVVAFDELLDEESEDYDFDAQNDEEYLRERNALIEAAFGVDTSQFLPPFTVFHSPDRMVTQLWMDDPVDPQSIGPGGVTVMVDDVAVSLPWWYDGGNLRWSWPSAIRPENNLGLTSDDLGPQLRVGESWDLPTEGLAVVAPDAIIVYDESATVVGHIPTTTLGPDDGTITDWFTAAGRDLALGGNSVPYNEDVCVNFNAGLEACTVDGVAELLIDGQIVAGVDDWAPLLAPDGIAQSEQQGWLLQPQAITEAAYNPDTSTWILRWEGVLNDVDCWRENTLLLDDNGLRHLSGGPINAVPPATPIGWVGNAIAYGIHDTEPTACSPGSDTKAIYLHYPDGTTTTVIEGVSPHQALTFTTPTNN